MSAVLHRTVLCFGYVYDLPFMLGTTVEGDGGLVQREKEEGE